MPPNTTPTCERKAASLQPFRTNSEDIEDVVSLNPRQPNANMRRTAEDILDYLLKKRCGHKTTHYNLYGETMYKLSEEMRMKHASFFNGLRGRLQLSSEEVLDTFVSVSTQIFNSGFNFGRLVSLYTWSLYVIEFCIEHNLDEKISTVIKSTADCLEQHVDEFRNLGGWDGFKDYFSEPRDKLWQGLMLTTFSFGALAALLYIKS